LRTAPTIRTKTGHVDGDLQLTRTTAQLLGENAAEWRTLEEVVRLGQWTNGPRSDEGRLRQLAAELGVPLREEDVVRMPPRRTRKSRMREYVSLIDRWIAYANSVVEE
jgi:hypothetical protein